jgi:hypothetical protein
MSKRMIFAGGILAAGFAAVLVSAQQAQAESGVPVRFAVQTTIGPSDAPVRTAEFNSTDRQKTSVDPVHWGYGGRGWNGGGFYAGGYGRGWNVGYRPYYGYGYRPYYAYRPYYYSYYPRYYSNFYPSYYVSNYAPPFYYPTYYTPSFAPYGSCYYW